MPIGVGGAFRWGLRVEEDPNILAEFHGFFPEATTALQGRSAHAYGESVATLYADSRQPSPDRPHEQDEEQETQEDSPNDNGNLPVSRDGKSEQGNEQREKSLADPRPHPKEGVLGHAATLASSKRALSFAMSEEMAVNLMSEEEC